MANPPSESSLIVPTIVFVPFFGGKRAALRRHMDFIDRLGLKWVFVDLDFDPIKFFLKPFSSSNHAFGMKKQWADRIEKTLNDVPGKKIIYSFSNPSAGAIEAIARRNAHDILGLICDGGPTGDLFQSILNYYKYEKKMKWLPARYLTAFISTHMISLDPKSICNEDLKKFPANLPILSIRGWKDPLISPRQIDLIFDSHKHLKWQKLSLPQGKHLDGLKKFQQEYEKSVGDFIKGLIV